MCSEFLFILSLLEREDDGSMSVVGGPRGPDGCVGA